MIKAILDNGLLCFGLLGVAVVGAIIAIFKSAGNDNEVGN